MLRQLDDKTLITGQISPDQIPELKRHGVTMIVNHRLDGEDPDQPSSIDIEAAAEAEGLEYRHQPIRRGPGPSEVEAMLEAMQDCEGKLLAFCRSGTRSTFAWALAKREQGAPRAEIERSAAQAGVDLGPIAHLL